MEQSEKRPTRNISDRRTWILALGALGIVYGDIGTSPLYALRECFNPLHGFLPSIQNVLGILSLIFWSLILIITVHYVLVVMSADNQGEGGILSLLSLAISGPNGSSSAWRRNSLYLGLFGAALLYGDSIITPAISVLSAIEGLTVTTPIFNPIVLPLTVVVLFVIFYFQSSGTQRIGRVFGPIILCWFVTIGSLGLIMIVEHPYVLHALNPYYAFDHFYRHGFHGIFVLSAVFLVVTGGEALYADMGHFGKIPIRLSWFVVVLPSLVLNYFGQGALIIEDPSVIQTNPFFLLAPDWATYPLVGLATLAAVIASQATISGAFSLTRQAVQLGYLPRLEIRHTSSEEIGQVYVPLVNWFLLCATIWLVFTFSTSANLANAYGIAVSATMIVTCPLLVIVMLKRWRWKPYLAIPLVGTIFLILLSFLLATGTKVFHGGWFSLVVAMALYAVMTTWYKGREILAARLKEATVPLERFIEQLEESSQALVSGTAIFMSRSSNGTPPALVHNVLHNKVLHEQVVLLSVVTATRPFVASHDRVHLEKISEGFYRVIAHYGFMQQPKIKHIIEACIPLGLQIDISKTTFFLGRETLIATDRPGMAIWRERLFAFLSKNSERAAMFYEIPSQQVIEIGLQVNL